jgi:Phosphopantetheine attachment site
MCCLGCLVDKSRFPAVQVDRRSLPRHAFEATAEYVAPANAVEAAVCSAWQAVLQHNEPISVHANFFELGGNSLSTGAVCSRVCRELALEQDVPAAWLFTHQTIRALADKISEEILQSSAAARTPLLPTISSGVAEGADVKPAPLSYQQEQFLQLWQQDPKSAAYNTPWGVRLQGDLDMVALQAAVQMLAKRHLVSAFLQCSRASAVSIMRYRTLLALPLHLCLCLTGAADALRRQAQWTTADHQISLSRANRQLHCRDERVSSAAAAAKWRLRYPGQFRIGRSMAASGCCAFQPVQ